MLSIVLLLFLIASLFHWYNKPSKEAPPLCKEGSIDLSYWDFNRNGNVKLSGYWEFYPNSLLSPKDLKEGVLPEKFYITVPGRWTNSLDKKIISDRGLGTYRLRAKINKDIYMYGLKIINIRSSAKIFVNGKEIGSSGNPAPTFREGYVLSVLPIVTFFPSEGEYLDIVIQVANLDYYNGGIIQNVYLGSEKNILNYDLKLNILDVVTISCLMLSSIYYFGIYLKRKQDKRFIYFSILCITYAYVTATGSEKIFNNLFPSISYIASIRLKTALICLGILLISLFIRAVSRRLITDKYMKIITLITITSMLAILTVPTKALYFFENTIGILNISIYILIAILILRDIRSKSHDSSNKKISVYLLITIIIVIFQYISAGLYFYSIISSDVIPIFTFFMLLLVIATMLSEEYARAYSELEIMSQNLIIADKIKDEFLINTSHEFKTPLHAIINISQSELNKHKKNYEENLSYITSIATRLSSLVNDIIDFENLQNGSIKFTRKAFDINNIIQGIIETLSYMRKGDDITLINNVPRGKYCVYADENRCKQILNNLIGNSLKYTEQGFVEVEAYNEGEYVCISVKDTGSGISENIKEQIFKRNVQGEEKNFTENSSSGLGLSISKLLANNMGGDIYLKYSEPNEGSIFVIRLPKAEVDEKEEAADEDINSNGAAMGIEKRLIKPTKAKPEGYDNYRNLEKQKILFVDDEPSNIKVLKEIFHEEYYETLVAYNGAKALELIKVHKDISLVLLDVMMPGLSGYEVCRRIRENYTSFELPILLLTVRSTPEDIEIGLKAGANDFLAKPFNYKELKARAITLQKMQQSVKEALKMETIFLQSQIKPHFLYNALSVIMSLCYLDGERAGNLLGELSNYLRCTFDIDYNKSLVSLKREISLVKSYVELEKARFGHRLKVEFDIEEDILNYNVPPIIIQPIVENSIRHGLMKRIAGGWVKISIKKNEDNIIIKVEDDGVGIEPKKLNALLDNSTTGSIGLKNVNKRLSNEYGQGLHIESKENLGTIVTMIIKLI